MKISELRKAGCILNREGMSKLAIKYIDEFDGSYKGAMILAGKLYTVARMATCDEYWDEQVAKGINHATGEAENIIFDSNR